jgi:hypothetical protein
MQFTVFLAHGMLGLLDELLPLNVAALFVVFFLISLVVQRRQAQSFSSDNSGGQKLSLAKVERNVGHENNARIWLD